MRRHKLLCLVVLSAVLSAAMAQPWAVRADDAARFDAKAALTAIFETWQLRQQRVRTGHFFWSHDDTRLPNAAWTEGAGWLPKETLHFNDSGISFAFDGEKYSYRPFTHFTGEAATVTARSAYTYNGQHAAVYDPPIGRLPGEGQIRRDKRFREFSTWLIWPFLLAFRPLADIPEVGIDRKTISIADMPVSVRGTPCADLGWTLGTLPQLRRRLLVEQEFPHRVRRVEQYWRSNVSDEEFLTGILDFLEYGGDDPVLAVPIRWNVDLKRGDGADMVFVEGRLESYSLNEPIDDAEFNLVPFPEGTRVYDEIQNRNYWQRANGRIELIEPPSQSAKPGGARTRWEYALLLTLNVILFCAGWWFFVIWQRSRRDRSK